MPPRFAPTKLVDYPWVVVWVNCVLCRRAGRYRLARLAARYGPEQSLAGLLADLAGDCPWWRSNPRKYEPCCGIRFFDLEHLPPPDHPGEPVFRQRQAGREDLPKPAATGPTLAQWTQPRLKPLLIELTCRVCAFHDWHRLSDLRERYGEAALLAEVLPHLTPPALPAPARSGGLRGLPGCAGGVEGHLTEPAGLKWDTEPVAGRLRDKSGVPFHPIAASRWAARGPTFRS